MDIKMIDFQTHGDDRGSLVVAEYNKELPFVVRRIYYIYGVSDGKRRGYHSHRKLQQIYIAIHGSVKVDLDDGVTKQMVELSSADKGLFIGHNIWREIYDFSPDAVLLVLASDEFSESDYIRSYDEFVKEFQTKTQK